MRVIDICMCRVRSFIILSATAVFRRRFTFRASLQVFDTSIPFGHRPSTLIRMELKGCRKFTTIIIRSCSHDSTLPQLAPSLTILLPSLANVQSPLALRLSTQYFIEHLSRRCLTGLEIDWLSTTILADTPLATHVLILSSLSTSLWN